MATASLFAELTSFVSKLSLLNSYGCNANLNFNAGAGRIHVAFHTDLGYDHNFSDTPSKKFPNPLALGDGESKLFKIQEI